MVRGQAVRSARSSKGGSSVSVSGITHMPTLTSPTLRPEPPNSISVVSSNATRAAFLSKVKGGRSCLSAANHNEIGLQLAPTIRTTSDRFASDKFGISRRRPFDQRNSMKITRGRTSKVTSPTKHRRTARLS